MKRELKRALAMGLTVAMGTGMVSADVTATKVIAAEVGTTKQVEVKTLENDNISDEELTTDKLEQTAENVSESTQVTTKESNTEAVEGVEATATESKTEAVEATTKESKTEAVEATTKESKTEAVEATTKESKTEAVEATTKESKTEGVEATTKESKTEAVEATTKENKTNTEEVTTKETQTTTATKAETTKDSTLEETKNEQTSTENNSTTELTTGNVDEPQLDADGTYNGLTYNVSYNQITITGYTGNGGAVNIPSKIGNYPVTAISGGAFRGNDKITSVTIPGSVKEIGGSYSSGVFENCTNLKTVTINGGNQKAYIGASTFKGCTSLKTITIPSNYTNIYNSAFQNCRSLTKVVYNGDGKTEQYISYDVFENCPSLTSVTLPKTLREIGSSAFSSCTALTTIDIPEGVTSISYGAFYGCKSLKTVTIPSTITQIGSSYNTGVFEDCTSLTNVTIKAGNSEAVMDYNTFKGCKSLTSITIPGNYSKIKSSAFENCSALKTVNYSASVKNIKHNLGEQVFKNCQALTTVKLGAGLESIGSEAFINCTSLTTIDIPTGTNTISSKAFSECTQLATVNIPEGVTTISYGAFYGCKMLKNITIPSTVTQLGNDYNTGVFEECSGLTTVTIKAGKSVAKISDYSFKNCKSLASITVPGNYSEIGYSAFLGCNSLKSFTYSASVNNIEHTIGNSAFENCLSLSTVSFGKGLIEIGRSAFEGTNILKLSIPEGTTKINSAAFANCKSLTSVSIPATIKNVGTTNDYDGVFEDCISLTSVSLAQGANVDAVIGNYTFKGCTALKNITIPGNYQTIGHDAFKGCSSLQSLEYKKSSYQFANQSINYRAFQDCTSLKSIKLPNTLKTIDNSAFSNCKVLKEAIIPEGVESIGDSAFNSCEALEKVTIPSTTSCISDSCFYNCKSLKSVVIAKSVNDAQIESYAFEGCSSLTSISIPGNYTSIGNYAFRNCTSLEKFSLEEGQYSYANQSIGYGAFYRDSSLSVVTLPSTVSSINSNAFAECGVFTMEGVKGSEVESFANSNGLKFRTYSQPLSIKVIINPTDNTYKGDIVNIQAIATGGSNNYTYKLVVYNEDTKKWGLVEDYGPKSGFTWTASTAGNRKFYVKVKDSTGKEVLSSPVVNVNKEFKATASYKNVNNGIQFTANGVDGSGNYQYKFIVYNEATKKWGIVQDYSSKNTCTWNNTNATAGNRKFYVDIKDSTGKVARSSAMNINIKASELKASLSSSATQVNNGNTIKLTASASGGYGNYQYKFIVYNTATKQWGKVQDYSSKNTCKWKASSNGTRQFYVDIKDAQGNVKRSPVSTVKVGADIKVNSTISTNNNKVGSNVMLAATASGGYGTYTYKFIVYNKDTKKWGLINNFSATNAITWKASSAGNRVFYVDVKDSKGNVMRSTPMSLKTTK